MANFLKLWQIKTHLKNVFKNHLKGSEVSLLITFLAKILIPFKILFSTDLVLKNFLDFMIYIF